MDSDRVQRRFFDVSRALLGVTLVAGIASAALADEQTIRRVLGPKLSGAQIVSIQKLPGVALYEVAVLRDGGHAIFYTDASAQYVIRGSVMDVRSAATSPRSGCASSRRSNGASCRSSGRSP